MCVSGASMQTTSGSLYPSDKVVSLSSRAWGVVLALPLRRVKIPVNPGMLGLGSMATTLAMVSLFHGTCARTGADVKVGVLSTWFGAGGGGGVRGAERSGRGGR